MLSVWAAKPFLSCHDAKRTWRSIQVTPVRAATSSSTEPPAPQELWRHIQKTYTAAVASGSASTIGNTAEVLQGSTPFSLRVADALKVKPKARKLTPCAPRTLRRHAVHALYV